MGYSIATHARSRTLKIKMVRFMERHYRHVHEVFGNDGPYCNFSYNDKSVSKLHWMVYDKNQNAIGFDYSSFPLENDSNQSMIDEYILFREASDLYDH
jgi:hypothetical protein